MTGGYMGKVLFVDLGSGKLTDDALDDKLRRDFIGGYGIGARLLFSRQAGGVDPLGAENTLGFLTGPLTGTPALSGRPADRGRHRRRQDGGRRAQGNGLGRQDGQAEQGKASRTGPGRRR